VYYQLISQCSASLRNVEGLLDKAEQFAAARNIDAGVLPNWRLAADMQPLIYQVQSACDYLKGAAAWLSGQIPPRHEDNEQTIGELRSRIHKTIEFASSVAASDYAGAEDRWMKLSWRPGKVIAAEDYLLQVVIPNFFFHLAMIYAVLRNAGVGIGKMDFLGPMNFVDG
jgi:hypothetical protein